MTYAGGSGKQDFDSWLSAALSSPAGCSRPPYPSTWPTAGRKAGKQRSRDSPVTPKGKQTVKQLIGQNQGVSNIEINDPSIRDFERIARKYGVDYAVKKDRSTSPPKYLIFFKARDADALTAAFSEYTQRKVKKADRSERPSVLEKLSHFKELIKNAVVDRTKRKELER